MPARRLIRTVQEEARDIARSLVGTPEFVRSRNERKKVELDFLPESGGVRSEYHAAARIVTASMLARASAGVR
jgi:hypothetical protein